ncbi:MAG: hypothetical protein AABY13_03670, partial [Nanoarchaeota archaeon]
KRETTGKGGAGLICGIFGILVFLFPPIGFPLAGLAIVLSRAQVATKPTGLATAALVLGIIGICLNAIILTVMLIMA